MFEGLPKPLVDHILSVADRGLLKYTPHFRAEELLYCLRKAYFRRMNEAPSLPQDTIWKLYRQTLIEEQWQSAFQQSGFEVKYEDDDVTIVSRVNFVHDDCVYLIRTLKSLRFLKRPFDTHVKLVSFQAKCLGLGKAKIVYVAFDGIQPYDVPIDDGVIEYLVDRAKILRRHLETREPPAEVGSEGECSYCEFKSSCERWL